MSESVRGVNLVPGDRETIGCGSPQGTRSLGIEFVLHCMNVLKMIVSLFVMYLI